MNQKTALRRRIPALLLALLLLSTLFLPACKRESAGSSSPMLTLDGDKLLLTASPNDAAQSAHRGQKALLYELLPGEPLEALAEKTPIAEEKADGSLRFEIPLTENGFHRLYCRYVVAFSDGTLLTPSPLSLSDPADSAPDREPFPHANSPKGLGVGNGELSTALHAYRAVAELSLAELLGGDGFLASYNGTERMLNSAVLSDLDVSLRDAARHGQQITLHIRLDQMPAPAEFALVLHTLLSRYTNGEFGTVTALALELPESDRADAAEYAAELLRISHLSLRSRVSCGKVYLALGGRSDYVTAFAPTVGRIARETARMDFGVALLPVSRVEDGDKLGLSDLGTVAQALTAEMGRSLPIAVMGLELDAPSEEAAALYTYAFRAATLAKAELIAYRHAVDDETGLYASDHTARPLLRAFAEADTASNTYGEEQARIYLGRAWEELKTAKPQRLSVQAVANLGMTDGARIALVDLTNEKSLPTVLARGRASEPEIIQSALWNQPVLTASLRRDTLGIGSGYTLSLASAKELAHCQTLVAKLLAQSSASTATVTLLLEGTATDGRPLTCTSSLEVPTNSWQAVTFHARAFTSLLDPSAPCALTLVMETEGETEPDAPYSLFLHSVNGRAAKSSNPTLTALLIAFCSFAAGAAAVLLLSFRRTRRERRRR